MSEQVGFLIYIFLSINYSAEMEKCRLNQMVTKMILWPSAAGRQGVDTQCKNKIVLFSALLL